MTDDKTLHEQAAEHKAEGMKDKASGAIHEAIGNAQEAAADLGDKVKEGIDNVQDAAGDMVDDVKDDIHDARHDH
jgi:uncharacterized protein YjbJ (UPF0337 family)